MNAPANRTSRFCSPAAVGRVAVVFLGIFLSQFILYGPSLLGKKILLPLDLLSDAASGGGGNGGATTPHDRLLSDPICAVEPMRIFAVNEVRSGRLPLWDPNNYCGAPFLAANQAGIFSPLRLLDYAWPSPVALAWGQMLRAMIAGFGAYLFFRCAMRAQFWPATIGAWIWPQSGFLVLWTMWPLSAAAIWLPWILFSVHRCIRRPGRGAILLLAISTACTIVSGHSATGAQVLIGSGIYALWMLWRSRGARPIAGLVAILLGWFIGICLASPQLIPTLEYMQQSLRMVNRRSAGAETPPIGLKALPQIIFPWILGTTRSGWIYLGSDIPLESAIAGYSSAIMLLVFLPIAFFDRRRRMNQIFWILLSILCAAYVLRIRGARAISHLPVLSSLRPNRMIFVSGFALLAASVAGLDVLWRGRTPRNAAKYVIPLFSIMLAIWCIVSSSAARDAVARVSAPAVQLAQQGGMNMMMRMVAIIGERQDRFVNLHWTYAALCAGCAVASLALCRRPKKGLILVIGLAACAEVIVSAWDVNPQSDPQLYDWSMPLLKQIAQAEPGRICGVNCLPPMMNRWANLQDIRGYDAADPLRVVQVLEKLAIPDGPPPDPSAATYALIPRYPSALADFLSLRYLICRGPLPNAVNARFTSPDYFVIENPTVLPRVTVPAHAIVISDTTQRLAAVGDEQFDPRENVILESPMSLPASPIKGTAKIAAEIPGRVEIDYDLQTDGVIVLADSWDAGWRARVDGNETPVLIANHAFRAAQVPAGKGKLIFSYEPISFKIGLIMALVGIILLLILAKIDLFRRPTPAAAYN